MDFLSISGCRAGLPLLSSSDRNAIVGLEQEDSIKPRKLFALGHSGRELFVGSVRILASSARSQCILCREALFVCNGGCPDLALGRTRGCGEVLWKNEIHPILLTCVLSRTTRTDAGMVKALASNGVDCALSAH